MVESIVQQKCCPTCGNAKSASEFFRNRSRPDGLNSQCKECIASRPLSESGIAKRNAQARQYYRNRLSRGPRDPVQTRISKLRLKYGLTLDDYDALLQSQNGVCGICGTDQPGGRWNRFAVDHCHETGKVRGLLCDSCNHCLGRFGDNLDGVMRAVRYLRNAAGYPKEE